MADFCSDFDGDGLLTEWPTKVEENGGTLGGSASTRSGPTALHVTTPAATEPLAPRATLVKEFTADVATLSITFDIAPTNLAPVELSSVGLVEAAFAGPGGRLGLLVTKSGPKLGIKDGPDETSDLPPFPNTREWTHVEIVAHGGTIDVSYDGAPVKAKIPFPFTSSSTRITLGAVSNGAAPPVDIRYDNVVVRFVR
jgi:hypothetical protein